MTDTRAAIYARISLDKTGEGLGVERQRSACIALAELRGWQISPEHIWVENDTSASTGHRPKFAAMIAAAEAGAFDVIIAWHVDRLTRKLTELEDLIALSDRTGVKIATASGDVDLTTDSGRLVGRILASVARGEVERKGTRQRAANQQRAEKGLMPKGRAFGYEKDGTPDETEAPIVRDLFSRFAVGEGLHTLTRSLADAGVMNTRGKPWTRAGVRDLLTNPRYIAERWILRSQPDGSRAREYVGPGVWEPLVSEDLFRAVGAILSDPARRERFGQRGNARRYLGAGCYVCGECGAPLKTGYSRSTPTSQYRTYVCPDGYHVSRRADYIDEVVDAVIGKRLNDPKIAEAVANDDQADVRALRDESNGIRARIDGFASDLADGLLTARQVKLATDRAEARLREVDAQLASIGSASALGGILGATDPAAAWRAIEDVNARATVVNALCTVRIQRQPRGRRPSHANPEKVEAWWEKLVETIEFDWHRADA
ncbi:recombinase family protein [Microbacterium esteraromaticum]|uniref:recombinase family protein n=1 Tax=Microbacterium esteraromaticum TaxID=57043 RepID=UPI0019D3A31F|nr:recombinase family protein [Microbacterium esteraromaticum]MBN7792520.1 recombinase family protein [Microbacterium esteraromaticum]